MAFPKSLIFHVVVFTGYFFSDNVDKLFFLPFISDFAGLMMRKEYAGSSGIW